MSISFLQMKNPAEGTNYKYDKEIRKGFRSAKQTNKKKLLLW